MTPAVRAWRRSARRRFGPAGTLLARLSWHLSLVGLMLVLAGSRVARAATPDPTQAAHVMGGGPPASQSGDAILALTAVVALGCLTMLATLGFVAVRDRARR